MKQIEIKVASLEEKEAILLEGSQEFNLELGTYDLLKRDYEKNLDKIESDKNVLFKIADRLVDIPRERLSPEMSLLYDQLLDFFGTKSDYL